ncbi:sensor histidine kinase [Nocardiopsis sp. L17-MgMaSL7]|uniref:sensor histidine kinase n=1 Tax=Nocardiopsis sp. L17-MgMaSL7 TaxID=1938893 RepID=UPI000D7123A5|nr:histidine kinase [Nocardiopsis sp. L17-MgMaSL7]PWV57640.1 two-component system sensor histidine kinase DesK [Nocardiopsis sp. L17-MgMaSL7]
MESEPTEATQGQLRVVNLSIVFGSISAVGALLISTNAQSLGQVLVLCLGLAAALLAVRSWSGQAFRIVAPPCLAVSAVVLVVGVLWLDSASAAFGISVVGTVVVFRLPSRYRRPVALGLLALVVGVIALKVVAAPGGTGALLFEYAVGSASIALVGVVFAFLNHLVARLVTELERARERDAELAVARERVRFAGDLHDIQGHTLHVVKLKVALARKLVHADTDQVVRELDEVYSLVGETIAETKELAHAQRRLNLSAELENAKNLFEAAGIEARVERRGEGEPGTRAAEMLGQVLRETTTNILRHAEARQVRITLTGSGISIVNDGVHGEATPELGGLAALRDRVERDGGTLTVEQRDGRFTTAAAFSGRRDDR